MFRGISFHRSFLTTCTRCSTYLMTPWPWRNTFRTMTTGQCPIMATCHILTNTSWTRYKVSLVTQRTFNQQEMLMYSPIIITVVEEWFAIFRGWGRNVWQGEVWRPVLDDDQQKELQGDTDRKPAAREGLFQALLPVQSLVGGSLPSRDDNWGGNQLWPFLMLCCAVIFRVENERENCLIPQKKAKIFSYIIRDKYPIILRNNKK